MKEYIISIILIFQSIVCFSQANYNFITIDSLSTGNFNDFRESFLEQSDTIFYEDSLYIVRKTCSGEWGGSVWFRNKNTDKEYSCESTCPVIINKIMDKYFVTNTLAHLMASSYVIQIDFPDSMEIFKLPKPVQFNGYEPFYHDGYQESKSKEGTKTLVIAYDVLTLASFTYTEKLFHIQTDYNKTYLSTISSEKFVTIDTISDIAFWNYKYDVIKTFDKHLIVLVENKNYDGYIDIYENRITIIRYRK